MGTDRTRLNGRPAYQPCEAPARAQPGIDPLSDLCAFGGRDLAARDRWSERLVRPEEILVRAQRRQIDPQTLRRVDRSERRW
jgi:hypothetical protein